jgi:predicted ATPase
MHLQRVSIHPEKFPTQEHYPFNLPFLHQTPDIHFTSPVTFFVGENGSGKTTLLRGICMRSGIHIWESREGMRAKPNPYERLLFGALGVEWKTSSVPGSYFGSDIFGQFAKILDEWASTNPEQLNYFGGESLLNQSHGQSLMAYFKSRYRKKGLYFLDEPETALSPKTQLELLHLIHETSHSGNAQFIIATHSPILMACPGASILTFDTNPLETISYEETEHFQIYHQFMNHYSDMIQ